jgi:hypothetical protein
MRGDRVGNMTEVAVDEGGREREGDKERRFERPNKLLKKPPKKKQRRVIGEKYGW